MVILKYKLKSSTLVEAVVALALLASITAIIFMVINNVNRGSNVGLKVRAFNEVNNIFNISMLEDDYSTREFNYTNFYVIRKAESSDINEKLIVLSVTAYYANGPQIARKQRIVRVNEDSQYNESQF